jgi:hypothetical protein
MRCSRIACGLVIALVGLYGLVPASAKEMIDSPAEAAIPSSGPQPIVLAWPAIDGQRGVLDSPLMLGCAAGPTVNANWEPLQKDRPDPKDWNEYGGSISCDVASRICGDIVLSACLPFDNIIEPDGFGLPLVQIRTFVRYTAGTNDEFFRHILNGALLPRKSRELHAARHHLRQDGQDRYAGTEPPDRLHTRDVWLFNVASGRCPRGNIRILPGRIISS